MPCRTWRPSRATSRGFSQEDVKFATMELSYAFTSSPWAQSASLGAAFGHVLSRAGRALNGLLRSMAAHLVCSTSSTPRSPPLRREHGGQPRIQANTAWPRHGIRHRRTGPRAPSSPQGGVRYQSHTPAARTFDHSTARPAACTTSEQVSYSASRDSNRSCLAAENMRQRAQRCHVSARAPAHHAPPGQFRRGIPAIAVDAEMVGPSRRPPPGRKRGLAAAASS